MAQSKEVMDALMRDAQKQPQPEPVLLPDALPTDEPEMPVAGEAPDISDPAHDYESEIYDEPTP